MKILLIACILIMSFGGPEPARQIIKQTTDDRGLTSVIFTEGKDTFAIDYMTRAQYDSVFNKQ